MKRLVIILVALLISLHIFLLSLDKDSEYIAEKELWTINKSFTSLTKDPKITPDAAYNKIINEYEQFVKDYPDSKMIPISKLFLGRTLSAKKDFTQAREQFESIIKQYPDDLNLAVRSVAEIGRSYALEEDYDNVLKIYERILKEYPLTDLGLKTPLFISKFYADRGQLAKAEKSFDDAIQYYQKLALRHFGTAIEFRSLNLMASCYIAQERWNEGIAALRESLFRVPTLKGIDFREASRIVKTINSVSLTKLEDYDLPIKIYSEFMKKFPRHPFSSTFGQVIEGLEILKKKKEDNNTEIRK